MLNTQTTLLPRSSVIRTLFQTTVVIALLLQPSNAQAPTLPVDVGQRSVIIFSDGVRMAGDLYFPKAAEPKDQLPGLVFCNGTGGTKANTGVRTAPLFAKAGYVVLAFDYRGWGLSDSKLITTEAQPRPDSNGDVQVKARAVRWQMDYADQLGDIRAAIVFLAGELNVDRERIGIWGTSYGGGLALLAAGNDPHIKAVVSQVPGMGINRNTPKGLDSAFELLSKQSRGEVEPVPFETGKLGGKLATYAQMRVNPAKGIGYYPLEAVSNIQIPTLILDAGSEELMDIKEHGGKAAEILKANHAPVDYRVIPEMTHYGVYKEKFEEVTAQEILWLDQNLKR